MPLVSVLMVFHRDTVFLRPAIASVLGQTWRDFELVLVDNGAGLAPAALGDLGADPRLRWVRLPANRGIPVGHNAGVAAARGEFVALLDYDDLAKPHRLECQVAALRARPEFALVSGLAERIDVQGRVLGRVFCLPRPDEHYGYSAFGGPVVLASALLRREILARLPYREEFPFAADLDFQARLAERAPMLVLPEVLLSYRWYDAQTTQQRWHEVEQSRCVSQVCAGRRRGGQPEDPGGVLARVRAPTAGASWRQGARVCLAGGFPLYAAYQARRYFACDRTLPAAAGAIRLAARAVRAAARGERSLAARMFLNGPVRALGLHPA